MSTTEATTPRTDIHGKPIGDELVITTRMYDTISNNAGVNMQATTTHALLTAIKHLEMAFVELRDGEATA